MKRNWPIRFWGVGCVLLVTLAGCGGDNVGPLYPVKGMVKLNGKQLMEGEVYFTPDAEKGNKAKVRPFARFTDGTYNLTTNGKEGAPAGWYKVTVATAWPGGPEKPVPIPDRYKDPVKSRLSVEVVVPPAPTLYDLNLTK